MTCIFDIETNGLYREATEVHCISIKVDDEPTLVFTSRPIKGSAGSIDDGLLLLSKADLLVGHNIINFDLPTLKKLNWTWDYNGKLLDTLIVSKLKYPNIALTDANRKTIPPRLKGSHSLKAWGYRLRKYKGDYGEQEEAWDKLTEDMVEYCRQDTEVTYSLYKRLQEVGLPPQEAIDLEQDFATIISRQEKYGVYFDLKKARSLHVELLKEAEEAERELYKTFKPLYDWIPVNKADEFTKSGKPSKNYLNQVAKGCKYNEDGEWGYFKEVVFNPSSRQHIARWLQEVYYWKPKEHTEKGSIVINEKVLENLDFPEGKILAHYFNVKKLLGQLAEGKNSWLNCVDENTSRIYGRVDTLGAVTRRCTHSTPNMAQVPSGKAYKGHECRALFCVPKGKKLVGCDADALELRTLSHYMAKFDAGKYAKAVDEGNKDNGTDIHTLNQKAAGLPTRDDAKTFIYAFLYGAGDGKIGEIVKGTADDGAKLKESFFRKIPAVKKLLETVKETYKTKKTLRALDGNNYYIRSEHSALNVLLQGAGALVMKYYNILADKNFQARGWRPGVHYEQVLSIHDECQWEVDEDIAEEFSKVCESSFNDVTKKLNFRIPLRGTADIGDNWSQTH